MEHLLLLLFLTKSAQRRPRYVWSESSDWAIMRCSYQKIQGKLSCQSPGQRCYSEMTTLDLKYLVQPNIFKGPLTKSNISQNQENKVSIKQII